jgi:hypothetical protein
MKLADSLKAVPNEIRPLVRGDLLNFSEPESITKVFREESTASRFIAR